MVAATAYHGHPMVGKKLAHYEVTAEIGAGGMGKVYRARDTRLGREVALKVLPEEFAQDPDRLSRFEREAKVLATLNHSNIGAIHGLEEAGGLRFLVLELLEGEDLAKRIALGPVSVDDTIEMAAQIVDALEAAHEQGIIHRDLKPANIVADADGKVKVLDFGLAKALEGDPGSSPNLSHSPTMLASSPTIAGVILGTAAYMSPEQARGRQVDRRSDIFSFGCVLIEMLTGRQAFIGETVSDTLAAVLRAEPDWDALPKNTPPALVRLLRRCLEKDPKRRLRDIGEARIVLDDIRSGVADAPATTESGAPPQHWLKRYGGWIATAVLAVALVAMMTRSTGVATDPAQDLVTCLAVPAPPANVFRFTVSDDFTLGSPAISPDGRHLVFGTQDASDGPVIWVQDFDRPMPRKLTGAENGHLPFWSPDSRSIGFSANGKLRTMPMEGGASAVVCDMAAEGRGCAWSQNGIIVFSPSSNSPFFTVDEGGGEPKQVTVLDTTVSDVSHRWPSLLPDGRRFLFTVWTNSTEAQAKVGGIFLGSIDGEAPRRILPDPSSGTYMPAATGGTGYILFAREKTLMAVPFDADSGQLAGTPIAVIEDIQYDALTGRAIVDAAQNGTIVYRTGTAIDASQLQWLDRAGDTTGELGDPANHWNIALSDDAQRVVAGLVNPDGSTNLWLIDIERSISSRFTFGQASEWNPVWSPDGDQIAYTSDLTGVEEIYVKPSDGSANQRGMVETHDQKTAFDWSADGRYLLYSRDPAVATAQSKTEIWVHDVEKGENTRLLGGPHNYNGAWFSPDGGWIVYTSDESGRREAYVRPLGETGGRWQISDGGCEEASWSDDGAEILYRSAAQSIMVVPIEIGSGDFIKPGVPRKLFDLPGIRGWDVTRDHQRILIARVRHDQSTTPLSVVINWSQDLGKR